MKYFNFLSRVSRQLIGLTVLFLIYGYLCRLANLYFFWESKSVGWVLFWLAVIFIFRDKIKYSRDRKKNVLFEKIVIGLSIFIILTKATVFIIGQQTDAYQSAKAFIKANKIVQNQIGIVDDVVMLPLGMISLSEDSNGTSGQADLHFIVKGTRGYMDLRLVSYKKVNTDWQTEIIE